METLTLEAPAKINLTLDILRRRSDGYHDMKMVMQTVSLCDTVQVTLGTEPGAIHVRTEGAALPDGPDNLAWRAADVFLRRSGLPCPGVHIRLIKRIPMQAGLAGGSADAAAVFHALRSLLLPALPLCDLEEWGGDAGSDVPFCIRRGTALAEGRGERLTTLPPLPECTIALCKPDFSLSTPALFRRIRVDRLHSRPDTDGMLRALAQGSLSGIAACTANVFEQVLLTEEAAVLAQIRRTFLACGALNATMSGSGPTVFAIFETARSASDAAARLPWPCHLTRPVPAASP